MQNPRRKDEHDDETDATPEPRDSPFADREERFPLPPDLWIDRDYPIHPGI